MLLLKSYCHKNVRLKTACIQQLYQLNKQLNIKYLRRYRINNYRHFDNLKTLYYRNVDFWKEFEAT